MNITQKMALLCRAYLDGADCDIEHLRQNLRTLFMSAKPGELVIFANHNENLGALPGDK